MAKEFRITPEGRRVNIELGDKFFSFIQKDPGAIRHTSKANQAEFGVLGVLSNLVNADEPGGFLEDGATFNNISRSMRAFAGESLWSQSDVRRFIKLAVEAGWIIEKEDDEDLVPRPRRSSGRRLFTR